MKLSFSLKCFAYSALMLCGSAHAAISCSVASNGFTASYSPAAPAKNITTASFTMSCTRGLNTDATSQSYTVKADNGLYPSGVNNQAASGANRIRYDLFTDSACGTQWKGGTTLGGTITFSSSSDFFTRSQTVPFYGCIAAGLNPPAGIYTDTVTMLPSIGVNATFGVTIVTPASCSISTPPGNITFNYASFQAGPALASTSFATTCSTNLPYTMALDATSGTLLGLNYTLSLSASSATGTGAAQTYSIDGTLASGQAGTCSTSACAGSAGRTLTITY